MLKKLGVGCGGLIVLIIAIVVATSGGNGGSSTASTSQATPVPTTVVSTASPTQVALASVSTPEATKAAPTATTVPTATTPPKPTAPPTIKILKAGETATLQDQTITLNSVKQNGNVYTADLTVKNTGQKAITVSSLASFEARDAKGYHGSLKLDLSSKDLDGDVQPGDKLHGTLSYEFPAKDVGLKLYYAPSFLNGAAAVFALDKTAEQEPWPAISGLDKAVKSEAGKVYKAGDLVRAGDLVIRLNKVTKQGTTFIADLTIYNAGAKPAVASSIMSLEAKDSNGDKGEIQMNTGSIGNLDGDILPGDTLSGGAAYQFAADAKGIKLYFNDSLFGTPVQFALSD